MTQANVLVRTGDKRHRLLEFTPVLSVRRSASCGWRAALVSAESLCVSECIQWILKGAQFAQEWKNFLSPDGV